MRKFLLLVSGGPDSMVLLELLSRQKKTFKLHAIHFNFHLRGKESNRDEKFVRKECQKRGVPLLVMDAPLAHGPGIQERARLKRYDTIKKLLSRHKWTHIFTAHHADDQAETILMRWMRGAGPRGLAGIQKISPFCKNTKLVRPLLEWSRREILNFAKENKISFVEDSSNKKDDYLRNKVRHHMIPRLKKIYPNLLEDLQKTADDFYKEAQIYKKKASSFLKKNKLSTKGYFKLTPSARFEVVFFLMKQGGFEKEVTEKIFDEVEGLLLKNKNLFKDFGNTTLKIEYGNFEFQKSHESHKPYWPYKIQKMAVKTLAEIKSLSQAGLVFSSKLKPPFLLRAPEPGDSFKPLGLGGRKKLSDYFIDKKIPREKRKENLVLTSKNKIIGLVGFTVDEDYKVLPGEKAWVLGFL